LRRCLDALAGQTYRNFEVVVVRGPCTDRTVDVLAHFRNAITIAETETRILGVSRNVGIAHSRGELIAFTDDDAVPDTGWLANLVPAFDDPEVGAAGGMVYRMGDGSIEWRNGVLDRDGMLDPNRPEPGPFQRLRSGRLNTVTGNCCMFRRKALEQIGGFDEEIAYMYDECDVVQRMDHAGYKVVHRPDAVVYHEPARSAVRENLFDYDWFVICKYQMYGALKNASTPRAWAAARIAWRLLDQRVLDNLRWWGRRLISGRQLLRSVSQCLRGTAAGLRKAWNLPAADMNLPAAQSLPIRPFRYAPARRLRVCLLSRSTPERSPDGIATYTFTLARALFERGCDVHVISRGDEERSLLSEGIWRHEVTPENLSARLGLGHEFPATADNLDYANAVWQKIRELDARSGLDIVEASSWNFEGVVAALDARIPVVIHVHSSQLHVIETQGWEENADRWLCAELEERQSLLADGVVTSTREVAQSVFSRYGRRPVLTAVIPLGLEIPGGPRTVSESRGKKVLFVGRLEPRKGIGVLLEAIPKVLDAVPEAEFDIVGKEVMGASSPVPDWRQAHRSLRRRVRFHGVLPSRTVDSMYEACDLLVAPSRYESFGLIYVEAMARGKAVIGTTAGGIPEVVRHEETGLLVPPDDAEALCAAIIRLLHDDQYRRTLGLAGYERYRAEFSAWKMAGRMLDFYRKVIARRAAQTPSDATRSDRRPSVASEE
jgi:glycosyltransferase involved in cell wall biosynthesis/GT2 family glycosyltransferase